MTQKELKKSIEQKLELEFKLIIQRLKSTLNTEEIEQELEPHLTQEEIKFLIKKL